MKHSEVAMKVCLRLPNSVFFEGPATKLTASAQNGSFGVLPNHIDFVTALVPGVLALIEPEGREQFFGIDEGVIVKQDRMVDICVRRAVRGDDLGALKVTVAKTFVEIDDQERTARTALARLEADMLRRFAQLRDTR
ncbi:MAG: F0F1 ATP synthase subunit epsilon [Alphaproteobacteria bacterium]